MWVKSTQQALQHFYCVLTVSHAPPTTVHLGNQRLGTSDCSNIQSFSSRWLGNEEVILLKTLCSIEKIYWCLKKLNNCDIFCTLFDTWDWVRDITLFFGGGFLAWWRRTELKARTSNTLHTIGWTWTPTTAQPLNKTTLKLLQLQIQKYCWKSETRKKSCLHAFSPAVCVV